jgi:hypothetical protein
MPRFCGGRRSRLTDEQMIEIRSLKEFIEKEGLLVYQGSFRVNKGEIWCRVFAKANWSYIS